jgi:hypothetical protein
LCIRLIPLLLLLKSLFLFGYNFRLNRHINPINPNLLNLPHNLLHTGILKLRINLHIPILSQRIPNLNKRMLMLILKTTIPTHFIILTYNTFITCTTHIKNITLLTLYIRMSYSCITLPSFCIDLG